MYKLTISDGREIKIFEESFRKACQIAEEYIDYYYGFAAHKIDYELEKLTETSIYHEEGSRLKPIEETHTAREWAEKESKSVYENFEVQKEKLFEIAEYNRSVLGVLCNLQNAIDELNEVDGVFLHGIGQDKACEALEDAKRTIATIQGNIMWNEKKWD